MQRFAQIYATARQRKGSKAALEACLPQAKTPQELAHIASSEYLAQMSKCIFRAGFIWRVIDSKWPAFEKAFAGFDPWQLRMMSDEALEALLKNKDIVRNWVKIKAVRENARFILAIVEEYGSFGQFIADWPEADIIGLWEVLKQRGCRLGGNTRQYFLRSMGKDTFILSGDVTAALIAQGVITKPPTAKRDLQLVQQAFISWQQHSGRPLCQISKVLACTIG